ncbi:MAG: hypothetical protein K0S22_947 [Oscillospiraceae bacterium]|jgi:DNA-binding transcriptional LysR family regulator|nr:hypothetical protein [Oscillospiraceae bacterium]
MELLQLRYFQVVATNQHITQSAAQLHVSQPAISTVITRLENELGAPLFERSGRTIVLNQYGKSFLSHVNKILLEIDNAKKEISDLSQNEDKSITLSVTSPQFIQGIDSFMINNPEIRWRQSVKKLPEITQMLENGTIDLCITSPPVVGNDIETIILLKDRFVLAVHPDHPLAKEKSVSLSEVAHERFIALHNGLPFREQTDLLFAQMGLTPNIVMECDHYLRREFLKNNAGVTLASRSAQFRHLYDSKIVYVPLNDVESTRDIALSRLKGKYITRASREFCNFLQDYYSSIGLNDE